ncbi:ribonuclease T [Paracoccus sp. p4-l81]|uniref:ribonuclease T2 family protein n=1 Tax=Paracoccus sp. p4-l81 TaxID=3342806 RepID=UPI0035B8E53D
MRLTHLCLGLAMCVWAGAAAAQDRGRAGDFHYYVLSLSWSPNWCATTGDARNAEQCRRGTGHAFVLHGLWPQYEQGWPQDCATAERDPSRRESQAMADIMGSGGLAWYQWQKHGRCTGLSARGYYDTAREAVGRIAIPKVFKGLDRDVRLPASVVEEAFLQANPDLSADMITITCNDGYIQEARICLTKDLTPRRCGSDALRDCRMTNARMDAVR